MIYSLINDISVFLMNEELNFQLQIVLSAHKSIFRRWTDNISKCFNLEKIVDDI